MKSSKLSVSLHVLILNLLSLSLLNSCGNMKISDTPLMVRLPASKTCFEVKVLSWQERYIPPLECDKIAERSIILTSEAWKMLKTDIQKNCQTSKCKQLTGAADSLFLAIDEALDKIPVGGK